MFMLVTSCVTMMQICSNTFRYNKVHAVIQWYLTVYAGISQYVHICQFMQNKKNNLRLRLACYDHCTTRALDGHFSLNRVMDLIQGIWPAWLGLGTKDFKFTGTGASTSVPSFYNIINCFFVF
jgi:hypothetical protein